MNTIQLMYFDAGGGHRSAANALRQVIEQQQRPWKVELLNLQELFDSIDHMRKLTGRRTQDLYNDSLKKGYTLGWPQLTRAMQKVIKLYHKQQVKLLRDWWLEHPADLVVSLIPNFNRAIYDSLQELPRRTPMLTVLTDLADYPPNFWIEPQDQFVVCGSDRAVQQARAMGLAEAHIFHSSGMILNPRFYEVPAVDRASELRALGLDPALQTGLVLFGGHGSTDMVEVTERLDASGLTVQLILICGHNEKLARQLEELPTRLPKHVLGFTSEVPRWMQLADFFIGKPGPGSLSEALQMGLPVIVERNAWTLPQERYNTDWVAERGFGYVLKSFAQLDGAVRRLLDPETRAALAQRIAAYRNRAVFEIPDMMQTVLDGGRAPPLPALPPLPLPLPVRARMRAAVKSRLVRRRKPA